VDPSDVLLLATRVPAPRATSCARRASSISTAPSSRPRAWQARSVWAVVAVDAVGFTLLQDQLQSVLATLSEREAGVVRLRFGLTDGQPRTLDQIGQVYGVTRERIRQIESKTMSKLRHPSRCHGLRDYFV
jgi:RNA polymerase sigma factor (sigma-70 family)